MARHSLSLSSLLEICMQTVWQSFHLAHPHCVVGLCFHSRISRPLTVKYTSWLWLWLLVKFTQMCIFSLICTGGQELWWLGGSQWFSCSATCGKVFEFPTGVTFVVSRCTLSITVWTLMDLYFAQLCFHFKSLLPFSDYSWNIQISMPEFSISFLLSGPGGGQHHCECHRTADL